MTPEEIKAWSAEQKAKRQIRKTPEEVKAWREVQRAALPQRSASAGNSQIVCPMCQERGYVRCKTVKSKKGISGGKATGAILTAGFSLLATGLSRKVKVTEAFCSNCRSTWQF
jgi:hypothetical protein